MVANGVVMLAAGGVALIGSAWPDIVTGLGIAALSQPARAGALGGIGPGIFRGSRSVS
jgi:hypothetical protein